MTQLIEAISTTARQGQRAGESRYVGRHPTPRGGPGKGAPTANYKPQVSLAEGLRKLYHEDPRFSSREQTGRVPIG